MSRRTSNRGGRTADDHKAWQLCRQVERALSFILAEGGDEVLADLAVQSVVPAPNASRLLVTVASINPTATPMKILEHLQRDYGRIRTEVAASINRRKAPELGFQCSANDPLNPGEPAGCL